MSDPDTEARLRRAVVKLLGYGATLRLQAFDGGWHAVIETESGHLIDAGDLDDLAPTACYALVRAGQVALEEIAEGQL